ncbi:MAG: TonB-dependent receptor domain-containing protein [Flavisolibacter sp.]
MKQGFITFIATLLAFTSIGQSTATNINGRVADSKAAPVESATVQLLNEKDSSIAKVAVTDKEGTFSFNAAPYGSYFISVSSIGFRDAVSTPFTLSVDNTSIAIAPIVLGVADNGMATVTVIAKRTLIEQKIDRMVINVDAAVTNLGSTALEVLEKSPGVAIDKDGNISLKGKSEVMVMIDGKPSYLDGADLAGLLSNMNANQLSQIEIMTNPSSKYEAAGNAGVINIKTKKSLTQGLNGGVTLSYGQGVYAKTNNALALNYRTSSFNAFLNYGYSINNSFMKFDIQRNFFDVNGSKVSQLDQQSNRISHNQNNNLKFGLDYALSKQIRVGFVATGFSAPQSQDGFTTSYLKDGIGGIRTIENTIRTVDNTWKNSALNLNLHSLSEKTKKDLSVNLDYLHYDFSGTQNINGLSYNTGKVLQASNTLKNILPLTIDIYSGRFDHSQPIGSSTTLETGIKASLVKTANASTFYKSINNDWATDSLLSNAFTYWENINAAYVNVDKKWDKWAVQAGLRLENTVYKGVQSSLTQKNDSAFSHNYTSLFPTAFVSYQANTDNQLALSIGRRIDRPAYQQLNPFIGFLDKYTYSTGNPFLQPQFSTNIELSHSFKNRFVTTLNYSVIHDMMNETLIHKDSIIIRSIGNIGTRYNYGISESATIPVAKWLTTTVFANLYQNKYDGAINGSAFNASQLTLSFNINNQFAFSNGWAAELSGLYTGRNRDEGQAIILPAGQVSAGIAKQLLNNKASVKLSVRDIFYTQNPKEIQNFQDVQSTMLMTRDTRVVNLAFVYKFGATFKSKSSTTPTDEQKRIQLN